MKKNKLFFCVLLLFATLLSSCSGPGSDCKSIGYLPAIYPDYQEVTIPFNIAPLNFCLKEKVRDAQAVFSCGGEAFKVKATNGSFSIPIRKWKTLLNVSKGKKIEVKIYAKVNKEWKVFKPFHLMVASEPIDPYLAYRLIDPGYTLWNKMGIYQRNLENFKQTPVYENKMTDGNCVNCHSFCMQNPEKMIFHLRATYGCTLLMDGKKMEKLNTKTQETISPLVYPSWHPSSNYLAFSVNKTTQTFQPAQRVEVYDMMSDVVVYDVQKHELVTCPELFSNAAFETFPSFSPDGKTLYFCTAQAKPMPESIEHLQYSLCSIAFDPAKRSFGTKVDTLYSAARNGKSISFPRVSPDGRFLVCTLANFGTFPIWHKEADLILFNLKTGQIMDMQPANSKQADSYHSWSSNSRWMVFSSRRMDGLYTRLFIAYVNKDGVVCKPFVVPQKNTAFYNNLMKSYNIPELIKGKVDLNQYQVATKAKKDQGIDVSFVKKR